jgi:bifunctional non-homologous end joining protein LigD
VIPAGEYGGGPVMLWDRGTWAPVEGKSWKDIDKGHLHFTLDGERMKGEWLLIRLKPRPAKSARTGCCASSTMNTPRRAIRWSSIA